jgi:hypothetical protein
MKVIPTRLVRTKFDIDILIDKISPVQYKVPIRVSDCCLTPIQLIFVAIAWRQQVNFQWNDDEVRFNLDQHAELDFYSASSLKQQSTGRHVAPLGHIILIPSQPVFALSP